MMKILRYVFTPRLNCFDAIVLGLACGVYLDFGLAYGAIIALVGFAISVVIETALERNTNE